MSKKDLLLKIDVKDEVLEAENRIRKYIRETPIDFSPYLSQTGKSHVSLKLENLQISGSFKLRGAMNKILSLNSREKKKKLVTASSGNHGAAFAYVTNKFGLEGVIYLPENASPSKIESLRSYGARIELYGNDCVKAEMRAKDQAEKKHNIFISPYNDPKIIGGQGTIGVELIRQIGKIDTVLVPVGGGGLISGIAGYLKSIDESIKIFGCQPENSPVMYESIKAGKILCLESKPTISDGTAGGIEQGSITFDICKEYVDDYIIASEEDIKNAVKFLLSKHFLLVEGAGALSVACFLKEKSKFRDKNVVLVISGSRIGLERLKSIL